MHRIVVVLALISSVAWAKVGPRDLSGYVGTDSLAGSPNIVLPAQFLNPSPTPSPTPTLLASSTQLINDGDDSTYAFNIAAGGTVKVYGTALSNCRASSNGFVTCGSTNPGSLFINQPLPDARLSGDFVFAPFFDDLTAIAGQSSITTAVNINTFIVQWNNFGLAANANARLTFRVEFQIGTNFGSVLFQYLEMTGTGADGSSATIGIQNANGYSANQYSYNTAGAVVTGTGTTSALQAVLFDIDQDGDRLSLSLETALGTNDTLHDTDSGGADDGVEIANGKNPLDDSDDASLGTADPDGDTLTAAEEAFYGTDPTKADTDGDSTTNTTLNDNDELYNHFTDPTNPDTDRDTFPDGVEIDAGTDPLNPNSHTALPNVEVHVSSANKYRPQGVLDSDNNIHIAAGMSSTAAVVGFYYYMVGPNGNVLIPETFIKVPVPVGGQSQARGLRIGWSAGKVYVLYELREGNASGGLGLARLDPTRAPRDGTAVTAVSLLDFAKTLTLPTDGQPNHVDMAVDGSGVHIVYRVDTSLSGGDPPRLGFDYAQLDSSGNVMATARLLSNANGQTRKRNGLHHKGSWPNITLGSDSTAHIVLQATNRTRTGTYYAQVKNGIVSGPYLVAEGLNSENAAIAVQGNRVYLAGAGGGGERGASVPQSINLAVFDSTSFSVNPRVGDFYHVASAIDPGSMALPFTTTYIHSDSTRGLGLKVLGTGAALVVFHTHSDDDLCVAAFAPTGTELGTPFCAPGITVSAKPNREMRPLMLPNGRMGIVYGGGNSDPNVHYTVIELGAFNLSNVPPPVTITNTPPIITSTPPNSAAIGVLYSYSATATDAETPSSSLIWSLIGGPVGALLTSAGQLTWTPTTQEVGPNSMVVQVCDNGTPVRCTGQLVNVTVNAAPSREFGIVSVPATVAVAGEWYGYQVVTTNGIGAISYTLVSPSPAPGNLAVGASGGITWTPTAADVGSLALGVTATDSQGQTATQSWNLSILPAGASPSPQPRFTSVPSTTAVIGTNYEYQAVAVDSTNSKATFTYTLTAMSGNASITPAGLLTWKPTSAEHGSALFTVVATEPGGASASQSFTVSVLSKNVEEAPGCSCEVGGGSANTGMAWLLLGFGALLVIRRRRLE